METTSKTDPLTDEWCAHQFDHLSPEFALNPHDTLARIRSTYPIARSEQYGGFWVLSRYEDVLRVARTGRRSAPPTA